LNRRIEGNEVTVSLFNPSIADYVLRKTSNSAPKLSSLMTALLDIRSLDNFEKLRVNGIVTFDVYVDVIRYLCKTKLATGSLHPDSVLCMAKLCELALQHCDVSSHAMPEIHLFVQAVSELPECSTYLAAIAPLLVYELQNQLISNESLAKLLHGFDVTDMNSEELESVSKILPLLPVSFQPALDGTLRSAIVEYWQNFLQEEIVERDILGDFFDYEDSSRAEKIIEEELGRILDDYEITFTQGECDQILRYVDVGDIINGNIKRTSHYDDDGDRGYVDRGPSQIDDLFSFDVP